MYLCMYTCSSSLYTHISHLVASHLVSKADAHCFFSIQTAIPEPSAFNPDQSASHRGADTWRDIGDFERHIKGRDRRIFSITLVRYFHKDKVLSMLIAGDGTSHLRISPGEKRAGLRANLHLSPLCAQCCSSDCQDTTAKG